MLDIKLLRANLEEIKQKLAHRGEDLSDFDQFEELDTKRRELIVKVEELKGKRNEVSQQVAALKREKKDADHLIKEMREVGEDIKKLDEELRTVESSLDKIMLSIPNIPHESVPVGETEDDNVEVRKWGELPDFHLSRSLIGILPISWIFLILSGQARLREAVSFSIKG